MFEILALIGIAAGLSMGILVDDELYRVLGNAENIILIIMFYIHSRRTTPTLDEVAVIVKRELGKRDPDSPPIPDGKRASDPPSQT